MTSNLTTKLILEGFDQRHVQYIAALAISQRTEFRDAIQHKRAAEQRERVIGSEIAKLGNSPKWGTFMLNTVLNSIEIVVMIAALCALVSMMILPSLYLQDMLIDSTWIDPTLAGMSCSLLCFSALVSQNKRPLWVEAFSKQYALLRLRLGVGRLEDFETVFDSAFEQTFAPL